MLFDKIYLIVSVSQNCAFIFHNCDYFISQLLLFFFTLIRKQAFEKFPYIIIIS